MDCDLFVLLIHIETQSSPTEANVKQKPSQIDMFRISELHLIHFGAYSKAITDRRVKLVEFFSENKNSNLANWAVQKLGTSILVCLLLDLISRLVLSSFRSVHLRPQI